MSSSKNMWLDLARVLNAAAQECLNIVEEELDDRLDWVDQSRSPLGPRRHIAATRRRLSDGAEAAGQSGRKYLLSPAALAEELGRSTNKPIPSEVDEVADLRRSLSLIRGGGE